MIEHDGVSLQGLSRNLASIAEMMKRNQAAMSKFSELLTPRITEVQEAATSFSLPLQQLEALNKSLGQMAALENGFAVVSGTLARHQIDIQRAFDTLDLSPFSDLSQIAVPPALDLSNLVALSRSLSASFDTSASQFDADAFSLALQSQFEPAIDRVATVARPSGSLEEQFIDFLWTWTLLAFQKMEAKLDAVDPKFILTIILTLVLHFHSLAVSNANFELLGDRIEAIERKVARPVEINQPERFLTVERLQVRAEPSDSAHAIITLSPNRTVELIRKEGDWYYVRYQDHVDELPRLGWIDRQYLNPIL